MTRASIRMLTGALLAAALTASDPSGATRRFLSDDPIAREPDTQDAAGVS